MPKFNVSCEVTYRRTWADIEADTAEEAQRLVFEDGCEYEHEETLVSGPGGSDDMEVEADDTGKECTCDDRSWYGDQHDSACDFAGEDRYDAA